MLSKSLFTLPAESILKEKNTEVKRYLVTQQVTMVIAISKILS